MYHVWARGNRREPLFHRDGDRLWYLDRFGQVATTLGWRCLAYCLMTNHVHHVIELTEPNLGRGIAAIHGPYARLFNTDHQTGGGHLFEKRYGATRAPDTDALIYLVAYVVLNPVRAGLCTRPQDHHWSSYAATAGIAPGPRWLDSARTHSRFPAAPHGFVETIEAIQRLATTAPIATPTAV